jgi:hypothetical protein
MKLYMFWTIPMSISQEFLTVHTAMVYVIQVCRQLSSSRIRIFNPDPARKLYHTGLLTIFEQQDQDAPP